MDSYSQHVLLHKGFLVKVVLEIQLGTNSPSLCLMGKRQRCEIITIPATGLYCSHADQQDCAHLQVHTTEQMQFVFVEMHLKEMHSILQYIIHYFKKNYS